MNTFELLSKDEAFQKVEQCHKSFLDWRETPIAERAKLVKKLGEVLPHLSAVDLEIYDLTGERIWSLQQLALTAGSQRLIWSGRDVTGRPAMPGLYIYRIHVDSDAGARRIIGTVAVVY